MNKKNVSSFLLVVAVFLFVILFNKQVYTSANDKVLADSKVKINLDGEIFYGVKKQDKILIPIRRVFEELNCLVCFNRNYEISLWSNKTYPVYLKVGEQKITLGEGTKNLNSPVEIIDDNSFVGIEFLDLTNDIFGAGYKINEDNSVNINKKPGQFKIYSDHFYQEIKSESGELKGVIACCIPIIEPEMNNAFIDKINKDYNKIFNDFIDNARTQINALDDGTKECCLYFDVSYNKNDLISILALSYTGSAGFVPDTTCISKTFDIKNNKELSLKDIFIIDYEKTIYDICKKVLNGEYANLPDDKRAEILELVSKTIDKMMESVDLKLSDPSLNEYVKKEIYSTCEKILNGEYKFSDDQRDEILKSVSELIKSVDFYLARSILNKSLFKSYFKLVSGYESP